MRRLSALFIATLLLAPAAFIGISASSGAATIPFPTVNGGFGKNPTITFPNATGPKTLLQKVIHQGSGPIVQKGNLLIANYLGQIWRGKVFDTSFGKSVVGFPIGVGDVVLGWDKTLVGKRVGSRVLLVIPPKDGYGTKGESAVGITGTDTIVFVVDIVGRYTKSAGSDPKATLQKNTAKGISVTGKLGGVPKIAIAKNTAQPKALTEVTIAKGHGPVIHAGTVVLQILVADWSGQVVQSTWSSGSPLAETVDSTQTGSPFDKLKGLTVGSRVVLELPKTSNGGPYALVVDVAAQA